MSLETEGSLFATASEVLAFPMDLQTEEVDYL